MSRNIQTIRERIVALRDGKNAKWKDICLKLGILKSDGQPDTGLAYDIYNDPEYRPSKPEVQKRLGISPRCPKCGRKLSAKRGGLERAQPTEYVAWWNRLKPYTRHEIIRKAYEEKRG